MTPHNSTRPTLWCAVLPAFLALATAVPAQVTHLFVDAATGSDANPGTQAQPFKSITKGVATGTQDTTIHVLPGIYSASKTGEVFTIAFSAGAKNVRLIGADANTCIIDFEQVVASQNDWYFLINTGAQNIEIAHLTMKNGAFQPAVAWYSSAVWWRSVDGLDLHHCFIETCESGIYSANGAQNVSVHDNVFLGCNIPVRFRQDSAVGAKNCRFYNNLVAGSTGGYRDTVSPSGKDPTQVFVNNLIINNPGDGISQGGLPLGVIVENNNCFNNLGTNYILGAAVVSTTNLSVDPQLVDFAKRDFRLKLTSPMIEAGFATGQPGMVNDFYGNGRVSDFDSDSVALPDIGVHEVPGLSLSVSNFAQGQTATFTLTARQTGVNLAWLYLSPVPASLVGNPFGSIGLDPSNLFFIAGSSAPGTIPLIIPQMSILNGAEAYFQAFAFGPNSSWRPSGRLDLRL